MMREISSGEYRSIEYAHYADLAERIRNAGVSYSEVARGTRLSYKTISRAARGQSVRSDAMIRIDYYLTILKRTQIKGL